MRAQFTFYRSFWDALKDLPQKDKNALLSAICEYALDGKEPALTGIQRSIFTLIKPTLDTSARKADSGRIGGSKSQAPAKQSASNAEAKQKQSAREIEIEKEIENEIEIENDYIEKNRSRYYRPSLDEVIAYVRQRGSSVDPAKFFEYYEAGGWKDGKGNPVKNWKQKLLTWEKHDTPKKQQAPKVYRGGDFFDD